MWVVSVRLMLAIIFFLSELFFLTMFFFFVGVSALFVAFVIKFFLVTNYFFLLSIFVIASLALIWINSKYVLPKLKVMFPKLYYCNEYYVWETNIINYENWIPVVFFDWVYTEVYSENNLKNWDTVIIEWVNENWIYNVKKII